MGIKQFWGEAVKTLSPFELKDSYLIIDGGLNIVITGNSAGDARLGGDYESIYEETCKIFETLKRCGVTPIVIMDGRYKEEKMSNIDDKVQEILVQLSDYNRNGFQTNHSQQKFPVLKSDTFFDALRDLKICFGRSDFEADKEIIELARKLKCPVLSLDTDFCLCDGITLLPWQQFYAAIQNSSPSDECIKCETFDREKFMEKYGLTSEVLPYIAVLFNNDYWEKDVFKIFNWYEYGGFKKQLRIRFDEGLNWLRNKSIREIRREIIDRLLQKDGSEYPDPKKLEQDMDFTIAIYEKSSSSLSTFLTSKYDITFPDDLNVEENTLKVEPKILEMVRNCRLLSTTLDMLTLNVYNCRVNSMEDIDSDSIYELSIPIIRGIHGVLIRDKVEKSQLTIRIRKNDCIISRDFPPIKHYPAGPLKNNQKLLFSSQIMNLKEIPSQKISFFDDGWLIFAMAYKFWIGESGDSVPDSYALSALLTAIILQVAKDPVKKKKKISDDKKKIKDYIDAFKRRDEAKCIVLRYKEAKNKDVDLVNTGIRHIHMYLTFQACLFFTSQLFALLELPYKIKFSRFISGTVFHDVLFPVKNYESTESNNWLNSSPNFSELYYTIKTKIENEIKREEIFDRFNFNNFGVEF